MARRCDLTGTGPQVGHKVSHSNIKTKTRFLPNLVNVTLLSDVLKRKVRVRITAAALRSVEHCGGLDAFLAKAANDVLSPTLRRIKKEISEKSAAA
jgi:large subunit ribosomal protein L28